MVFALRNGLPHLCGPLTLLHCVLELVASGVSDLLLSLGLALGGIDHHGLLLCRDSGSLHSGVDQHVFSRHWSMSKGRVIRLHQSYLAYV